MIARRFFLPAMAAVLVLATVAVLVPESSTEAKPKQRGTAFATLAQAAAQPVGPGKNTDKPAKAVRGGQKQVAPEDVLPQGRRVNGCAAGYGNAGQCVPEFSAGQRRTTCGQLKKTFPEGIEVTGTDTLGLDSNDDGLACGPGDKGVPRRTGNNR
jgi:hypothetical protein